MGNKGGKNKQPAGGKNNRPTPATYDPYPGNSGYETRPAIPSIPPKLPDMNQIDYEFLAGQTGLTRDEIRRFHDEFMANNPDGKLDRREFAVLYGKLRSEPRERLDEICEFVFRAFDSDNSGFLTFNEFIIAYALTSRGDLRKKLEFAFNLYDADRSGYLDNNEVTTIVYGMLDLLGADRQTQNYSALAQDCIRQLDSSNDGRISKDEFVNGLLRNYSLRALMSPFN